MLFAATIAVSFTGSAWAGSFRFEQYASYPIAGTTTNAVAIGDVTGDGRGDVIVATGMNSNPAGPNDNKVFIYAQHPNGGLKPPISFALSQTVATPAITLADLNKDHVLDIAVGHYNGITLLIANGAGGFVSRPIIANCSCDDLGALDIDLDGNIDIVGQSWDATLFYGDGQGGIRSTATLQTYASSDSDLKIGDVTGDNLPDLVLASPNSSPNFFIFPHNGTNGFGPVRVIPAPAAWIRTVAIGDFNHDGRNDIATATPYSQLWMHYQTASGQWATPEQIASASNTGALATVDLDRNGRQDLLATHNGSFGYYLQTAGGWGTEVLSQTPYATSGPSNSQGLAVGDVNHDGCPDAAAVLGELTLFRGCSNRAAVGDLNLDRKSDLLWRNGSTGANVIWRSASNATQQQISGIADNAWIAAGIGDFNRDGESDLLWRNTATGANDIWRSANSAIPQTVAPLNQVYAVAGVGDFDGDGYSDILWRDTSTGNNVIWKSADSATPRGIGSITGQAWQVAGIADFNGDGKSDILWRNSSTGENRTWQYSALSTPINVATVVNLDWKIAGVGDFNGDGKSDIFWRNGKTGANVIWRSANSTTQQSVTGVTNLAWKVVGTGDYDGDGKSDILWRNTSTGANVIWKAANNATQQPVTGVTNLAWKIVP
ncbi:VCBS repeat-containing protein [Lysobacter sp. CFH 32150]|uniref:FG-GAP repeat domain-containing protein n=1 Tax=Lysobacter sp. CFH 32150 TaxID=2927128 RepID=UPI001FA78DF1|nr:VCBS repeat-containing protein [Lysobacter sp. CFH 32150]MCI4566812.1 VCBS repeat-containing protein [Lysobacter sp. CFH 32150]